MTDTAGYTDTLEDCRGEAALYVLGALAPEKAAAFEQRLRSGCPFCSEQAEHFATVAESLPAACDPIEPRPDLRQRLLDRIRPRHTSSRQTEHKQIVRGDEARWEALPFPGVETRSLNGRSTLLIRMQPGAVFPQHYHPSAEQCYVLEGSVTDSDGVTLDAGDFIVMSAGIQHEPIHSKTGCTLLIAYAGTAA